MESDFKRPLEAVNRILVRGVNWVGDTILTYPAVQQLKALFPRSHVAMLVSSSLVDLWKTFPYVDEVIPFQKTTGIGSFRNDLRIGRSLKEKNFDLAVILPRSFRAAFQVYLARIPIRMGYRDEGRSALLTHGVARKEEVRNIHRIRYYQRLIEPLGRTEDLFSPRIFLRDEDQDWAAQWLRERGMPDGRILIGMNPGATYGLAKCWLPSRFGELGKRLSKEWKATFLLFGKEEERPVAEEILQTLGGSGMNLAGQTDLLQLAALLERCRLLVINDTGTMHVAAAVGTPVVALFGSTDPVTTGPWGEGHVVVKKDVPCSPCLKRVCPVDHRCMERISVEEVEAAVAGQLQKMGQS